jgi:hypothetical protein
MTVRQGHTHRTQVQVTVLLVLLGLLLPTPAELNVLLVRLVSTLILQALQVARFVRQASTILTVGRRIVQHVLIAL